MLVQLLMWLALAVAASTVQPSRWLARRRMLTLDDVSPVADLTAPIEPLVLPPSATDDGPEPSWSDEGDDPFFVVGDRQVDPDREYTLAVSNFTAENQATAENLRTIVDAPAAPDQGGDAS